MAAIEHFKSVKRDFKQHTSTANDHFDELDETQDVSKQTTQSDSYQYLCEKVKLVLKFYFHYLGTKAKIINEIRKDLGQIEKSVSYIQCNESQIT